MSIIVLTQFRIGDKSIRTRLQVPSSNSFYFVRYFTVSHTKNNNETIHRAVDKDDESDNDDVE